jgi:hypothetical protein
MATSAGGSQLALRRADVDAEAARHVAVAGAGTDHHAQAGAVDHPVQAAGDHQAGDGGEQVVGRIGHHAAQRHAAGQPLRRLHAVHLVADQDAAQLLEHQDQRIGHQDLLQVVALVEETEEHPFQHEAEQGREQHAGHQHGDEMVAEQRRHQVGQVGADHVEAAMGEVDHAHDAEDEGQAAGDQEQQQAVLDRIEALDQESRDIHRVLLASRVDRAAAGLGGRRRRTAMNCHELVMN